MVRNYSKFISVILVVLSLVAISVLDIFSNHSVSFAFFYLVTVALAVILLGRLAGVCCSVLAAGVTVVDHLSYTTPDQALWSGGIRLATLLAAVFLLHRWWQLNQHPDLQPTRSTLANQTLSPLARAAAALLLVYAPLAVTAYLDYRSNPHMSLSYLCLLPLAAAVPLLGFRGAAVYSVIASGVFFYLHTHMNYVPLVPALWNALTRLLFFLIFAAAMDVTWRFRRAGRAKRGESSAPTHGSTCDPATLSWTA